MHGQPAAWIVALVALGAAPLAHAGGLQPTDMPALDPADSAHLVIQESVPEAPLRSFARDGRFVGDLDGDGRDDIVLPAGIDPELEIWFGDASWGADGQDSDNETGDTTLELPQGCRQSDDRVHFAALGDVDGDGFDDLGVACFHHTGTVGPDPFEGAVAIWFGRPQPWGGSVADPDRLLLSDPVLLEDSEPVAGTRAGAEIAGVGDLDDDGYADFVVTGDSFVNPDVPLAWVFHGGPNAQAELTSLEAATWRLEGAERVRCVSEIGATHLGDLDGDDLADFAISCSVQPPPNPLEPTEDNEIDIGFSVLLGATLQALPPGPIAFDDRSFRWDAGLQRVPQAIPFADLGDLDGDGFGEAAVVAWFAAGASLSAQVLQGHAPPWDDILLTTDHPPFLPGADYGHPEGVQMAPAGPFPGSERAVWLRFGRGADAQVGLLSDLDPSAWDDTSEPPVRVVFTTPGGAAVGEDWRFGLGGPGDADGDGVADLLLLAGFEDSEGCGPDSCGGAWLLLCGDLDGDGVSVCAGDCDDNDAAISPAITEQCDPIDHDCDGSDGQLDEDGDGVFGCSGDCDDDDPERLPGAEETCGSPADQDCDGLAPQDDADADGTVNCEDCQPWDPAAAPGRDEVCDGLDNDCDGQLPADEQDIDRDGWRACAPDGDPRDCDDLNPFVHPHRFEDCSNGIDDDCNGTVDEDRDEDGDGVRTCEGDCLDTDAGVFPGAGELCDGLDNNCNGVIDDARDFDEDGFSECAGDCDNFDPAVFPGAVGVCEPGVDSNCDGLDDLSDEDGDGFTACSGDCDDGDPGVAPTGQDWCDRRDNDCDGVVDLPFDLDLDTWVSCLGDCDDGDSDRFPQIVEPDCADGVDGDCDRALDELDTDCPEVVDPTPLEPRPYGLSCEDCTSSVGGGGPAPLALLALALLALRRRRRAPAGAWGVVGLVLLTAVPASAARKEPGLLIYLEGQPDLSAMVSARDLAAESNILPEDVLHTSEFLPEVGDDLLVEGAAAQSWCGDGARKPYLRQEIDAALDAMIELDNRGAAEVLDAAIDALPCITEPLAPRILPTLYYYRGIARVGSRDRVGAEEDFRRVLALSPDWKVDESFPPEANSVLDGLRAEVSGWEEIPLMAFAPGRSSLRIDGADWKPAEGPLLLRPGSHVAQLRRGTDLWTVEFELAASSRPVIIHGGDRVRALKDCVLDPGARAWVAAVVSLGTLDAGVDVAALVDLQASADSIRWIYRVSDDHFSFEPPPEAARRVAGGPASTAGARAARPRTGRPSGAGASAPQDRVRLRVSGGYGYIRPFHYIQVPLDFGVRLARGLFVDASVEVSLTPTDTYGTVFYPTWSVGLSYRFETPVFQPRLGAVARFGLDSSPTDGDEVGLKVGWAGRVGFDIVPDGSPLLIGVDVQAGMLGLPLWISASGGVGVRF